MTVMWGAKWVEKIQIIGCRSQDVQVKVIGFVDGEHNGEWGREVLKYQYWKSNAIGR